MLAPIYSNGVKYNVKESPEFFVYVTPFRAGIGMEDIVFQTVIFILPEDARKLPS